MAQTKKQVQREYDSFSDNVGAAQTDPSSKSGQHSLSHTYDETLKYWTPQTDNAVILLRRLVQLLQPLATQDIQNRLRVSIDTVPSIISTLGAAPGAGPNTQTIGAPTNATSVYWQPVWTGPVDQRFQIIDAARLTYNQGIRSHLIFT